MPVLTLQNGERAGAAFPFDRPVVLGRGRRADIVVDDPSASRRHAQIELHGREWQVNDLDSANGTHLNGRPISRPTTIRPGDLIGIGGLTFRYEPDGKKDTPDTVFFVEEESPQSQIILSKPVEIDPPVASDPRQAQLLIRLAEILGTAFQEHAGENQRLRQFVHAAGITRGSNIRRRINPDARVQVTIAGCIVKAPNAAVGKQDVAGPALAATVDRSKVPIVLEVVE